MKSIIKKISQGLLVPLAILGLATAVVVPAPTASAGRGSGSDCDTSNLTIDSGAACAQGQGTSENLFTGEDSIFKTITNILLFLVGAISVIMLIIGGIRYVISGGDQNQVTSAKNTILYSIVGIVVAFLAYAAVNFVIDSLQP
jgi:hypothetical protein